MKSVIFSIGFSALITFSFAQDVKLSNRLIQQYDGLNANHESGKNELYSGKCFTPLLLEAKKNWNNLTKEAKERFRIAEERPIVPDELIFEASFFDIHYTVTGDHAVDPTDNDANGHPDYIDFMAEAADNVFTTDIETRGFTAPPDDGSEGGSTYFDIYVGDIDILLGVQGVYGYVSPEDLIEDNPNSADITEISAMTSYMVMRNNYAGFSGDEGDNVKVTLAHELSHGIDFGYGSNYTGFFLEAKGAWEEQAIYPDLTDNFQYLSGFYESPDIALDYGSYPEFDTDEAYDGRWYSGWLFLKYITDQTEDDVIIKNFLTRGIAAEYEGNNGFIETELSENWETDLETVFTQYLIANIFMTSDASFSPYTYSNATAYDNYLGGVANVINLEGTIVYSGTATSDWKSDTDGNGELMRFSADPFLLDIQTVNPFQISLTEVSSTSDISPILIMQNSSTLDYEIIDGKSSGGVVQVQDPTLYDEYVLLIKRFDPEYDGEEFEQYSISIGELQSNTAPSIADQTFSINENSENGESAGVVSASDADGDGLTFSIDGANSTDAFAINSSTGELTVNNSDQLDYETTTSFDYTVVVSDGAISSSATITINLIDIDESCGAISYTSVVENSSVSAGNGSIAISNVSGGVEPYSYAWDNGISSTSSTISNLVSGNYTVTITDALGCLISSTFTVELITTLILNNAVDFLIYPNPTSSQITITSGQLNSNMLEIINANGQLYYSSEINSDEVQLSFNFPAGIYFIKLNGHVKRLIIQ